LKLRSFILLILLIAIFAALAVMVFLTAFSGTFRDDFDREIKPAWSPKTPDKWGIGTEGENSFYRLKEPGEYDDGISRPTEYSLLGDRVYTDFTFKCKVKCDAPTYQRYRDVVVIFGYQDDTHFYYAHFSNISDDLHNAIMLVDGDYRQKLNEDLPEPTLTDLEFHEVKVRRKVKTGDIEVHFDGKLVMEANDMTFTSGKIGVGSFDDTGGFDDVYVKGKRLEQR
jgi:hypothetical protein